tara:strand:- start:215 stop:1012 length:798 start_codon:yes stop_codon:yes gene_type:complete
MRNKKVSVLMTVHNTSNYLKRAINSIISQTYKNIELIIVDDCSSDNSVKIIKNYKSKKIKKFFFKKNKGRIEALNFALKKSTGDYVAILDSDDFSNKSRLKTQTRFLNEDKSLMLVGSMTKIVNEKGKKMYIYPSKDEASNFLDDIHHKNVFPFSTVLFKKKIIRNIGSFSRNINYAIDFEFILRVKKRYKIYLIPKILGLNTLRSESLTAKKNLAAGRTLDLIKILKFSNKNFNLNYKLQTIIFTKILIEYIKYIKYFFNFIGK